MRSGLGFASLLVLVLGLPACSPSDRGNGGDGDDDGAPDSGPLPTTCSTPGETRCNGFAFERCTAQGTWAVDQVCSGSQTCGPTGCSTCDPQTNPDGCGENQCGADGTDLIYVVDTDYNLLSFNPRNDLHEFKLIGKLNCPAGPAYGGGTATPFSMSVDRDGRAWVLYNSGEIFWVDISNAQCQASTWQKGAGGFELFGMGFVSDGVGANSDTLFITGGPSSIQNTGGGNLTVKVGKINPMNMQVSPLGQLTSLEYNCELTGTGNAELYAYFPGSLTSGAVARLNKGNGQKEQSWALPNLSGDVTAWAFAHWGGRYYIFVTTSDGLFSETPQVLRLDPMGNGGAGKVDTIIAQSPYRVVGAGVSTCAPVIVE